MSNIRVDVGYTIKDGTEIKFRSPVDCSAITGLIVYYPGSNGNITSKVFAFADAHGNNVGDIDHLFAENVVVKVILDVTTGMAFVQNADTNAYLEAQFASKAPAGYGFGENLMVEGRSVLATWGETFESVCNKIDAILETMEDYTSKLIVIRSGLFYGDFYQNSGNCQALLYKGATPSVATVGATYDWRMLKIGGVWQEPEWVNPPMIPSVEYRTTERWNGKAVYAKLIDCGTTVAGRKQIANNSLYGTPIRAAGKISNSISPFIHQKNLESTYTGYINVESSEISVYSAVTGNTAYVTIWYVKN